MAIQVMTDVWQYSKADGTRLLVLLALADAADRETRLAFPGIKRIGEYARVSKRQVLAHIKGLIDMGEVARVKSARGQKRAEYEVLIGREKGAAGAIHSPKSRAQPGVSVGRSPVPSRVQPSVDPIIEPSTEPSIEPVAPSPNGAAKPDTWMTPYIDLHRAILGGSMQVSKWVRSFKSLEAEHGPAVVLVVQRNYLENLRSTGRQEFLNYHGMAEAFGTWVAKGTAGRPTQNLTGKDYDA